MVAALMTVMIALITVILEATKAAIADPVKSLRAELHLFHWDLLG